MSREVNKRMCIRTSHRRFLLATEFQIGLLLHVSSLLSVGSFTRAELYKFFTIILLVVTVIGEF